VRWHQDSLYFYLEPHEHVTAWVALSDASVEAGCMRVLPGSHCWGTFEHDDKPDPLNMIKRGQGISGRFDHETDLYAREAGPDVAAPHGPGARFGLE
jgi:non-heme Fe2+,alpha-ketoglutarate-dependent halogenase